MEEIVVVYYHYNNEVALYRFNKQSKIEFNLLDFEGKWIENINNCWDSPDHLIGFLEGSGLGKVIERYAQKV